ncbi:MAG: iron ABC transporter permease [Bacteroidetes bacterium]|nr:iron ABC transporter permease [Bacteroidota bacterium]
MKTHGPLTAKKTVRTLLMLGAILLACVLLSLRIGAFDLTFADLYGVLFHSAAHDEGMESARAVFLDIRIPRMLLALFVGGGLSVAGVIFQVLLRNVLADPYILGVSGGASVGALIALATGISGVFLLAQPLFAFAGALVVVIAVYVLASQGRAGDNTLLLSGVMIGAFLSAIILALVSTMERPVRNALYWLVGYLGGATMQEVAILTPIVLVLVVFAVLSAGQMNVIALGDEAAQHLGVSARRMQFFLYLIASLLTAAAVSFSGAIGFVGLIVPHLCRRLFGPDHRLLLPAAFLGGAAFLILSDILARSLLHPSELPVGAVTAALGAPVFIYVMRRKS